MVCPVDGLNDREKRSMARVSLRILALGAAIGISSVFGLGVASATPSVQTLGIANSEIINVNHRPGHWGPGYRRACTAGQAASKARRMGLRNPTVTVRRNVLRVTGWRYGHRSAVVFARARGCPIIR